MIPYRVPQAAVFTAGIDSYAFACFIFRLLVPSGRCLSMSQAVAFDARYNYAQCTARIVGAASCPVTVRSDEVSFLKDNVTKRCFLHRCLATKKPTLHLLTTIHVLAVRCGLRWKSCEHRVHIYQRCPGLAGSPAELRYGSRFWTVTTTRAPRLVDRAFDALARLAYLNPLRLATTVRPTTTTRPPTTTGAQCPQLALTTAQAAVYMHNCTAASTGALCRISCRPGFLGTPVTRTCSATAAGATWTPTTLFPTSCTGAPDILHGVGLSASICHRLVCSG
jgi:hypothetical protein